MAGDHFDADLGVLQEVALDQKIEQTVAQLRGRQTLGLQGADQRVRNEAVLIHQRSLHQVGHAGHRDLDRIADPDDRLARAGSGGHDGRRQTTQNQGQDTHANPLAV